MRFTDNAGRSLVAAFVLFALWAGLLAGALASEHSALGRLVFQRPPGGWVYLAAQGALTLATLVTSAVAVLRGSSPLRFLALVPAAVMVLYGILALAGPG